MVGGTYDLNDSALGHTFFSWEQGSVHPPAAQGWQVRERVVPNEQTERICSNKGKWRLHDQEEMSTIKLNSEKDRGSFKVLWAGQTMSWRWEKNDMC